MPTSEEFRASLFNRDIDTIVNEWLLVPGARHVEQSNIDYVHVRLAARYGVPLAELEVCITGSAKLGFSISEKPRREASALPRYRPSGGESDIDVAVTSRSVFELVWRELSLHSHRQQPFPWNSGKLGDYLVCGWLRPDHFPRNVRLYRCDCWWDAFRELSADPRFGRRQGDCRKIGGQAAIVAIGGYGSLAGWNFCPKAEPSVPL